MDTLDKLKKLIIKQEVYCQTKGCKCKGKRIQGDFLYECPECNKEGEVQNKPGALLIFFIILLTGYIGYRTYKREVLPPPDQIQSSLPPIIPESPRTNEPAEVPTSAPNWESIEFDNTIKDIEFLSLDITADGQRLILGTKDGNVVILNTETGQEIKRKKLHDSPVQFVTTDDNGEIIVSVEKNNNIVKIWKLNNDSTLENDISNYFYKEEEKKPNVPLVAKSPGGKIEQDITALSLTGNGKFLAVGGSNQKVAIWDIESKNFIKTYELDKGITSLATNYDGTVFAAGMPGKIAILKMMPKQKQNELQDEKTEVTLSDNTPLNYHVSIDKDGEKIIASNCDQIYLVDVKTTLKSIPESNQNNQVCIVKMNSDGTLIAGLMNKEFTNQVVLWEIADIKLKYIKDIGDKQLASDEEIRNIAFSRDGTTLIATYGQKINKWKKKN